MPLRQGINANGSNNVFKNGSTYNVTDEKGAWISGTNVTVDNFDFYNTYVTQSEVHNECAYVINAPGFIIRNSRFWQCPTMALMFTHGSWYGAPPWATSSSRTTSSPTPPAWTQLMALLRAPVQHRAEL